MMMVITSESIFKGLMILLFGGAAIALVVYLLDTPRRSMNRRMAEAADKGNKTDTSTDE